MGSNNPERYVSFESLMATDRVVKRRSRWVLVSMCGVNPPKYWLEFDSTKIANKARGSLLVHLREKRARGELKTDYNYNIAVSTWIDRLIDGGYVRNRRDGESEGEKDA